MALILRIVPDVDVHFKQCLDWLWCSSVSNIPTLVPTSLPLRIICSNFLLRKSFEKFQLLNWQDDVFIQTRV